MSQDAAQKRAIYAQMHQAIDQLCNATSAISSAALAFAEHELDELDVRGLSFEFLVQASQYVHDAKNALEERRYADEHMGLARSEWAELESLTAKPTSELTQDETATIINHVRQLLK